MVKKDCPVIQVSLPGEEIFSLVVAFFLIKVLFLIEISFISINGSYKWGNLYFLLGS